MHSYSHILTFGPEGSELVDAIEPELSFAAPYVYQLDRIIKRRGHWLQVKTLMSLPARLVLRTDPPWLKHQK